MCAFSFFIIRTDFPQSIHEIALLSLGMFFLVAFANAHNDITDLRIDKINRPERPLPSGKISIKAAYAAAIAWLLAALALGLAAGLALLFTASGALCFAYNRFLKGLPLAGNFAVALLATAPIAAAPIKAGAMPPVLLNLMFFAFALTFSREIAKDIEDIEGDKALGLKTFPALFGANYSLAVSFALQALCVAQIALFKPLLLAAAAPCLALSAAAALRSKWRLSQAMIKAAMLAGIAMFLIQSHSCHSIP